MQSFRTELENQVVEKDILELERKIFQFKNQEIDEEKFRSLRLARGVYGQRQQGVQMIRIKIPYGKITARQLRRIAAVSDEYSNGNLHITTRQDIQIHYVALERTPELWETLEKDNITLREACGNTVRNVTASIFAGVDTNEPFDVSPYAHAFFEYFLRNPICQELGRKFKAAFSSSDADDALSFAHDLGFIPKIKNNKKGFKVLLGGGIGSQPRAADVIFDFLEEDQFIPFSEAVIRVFDKYGERNRRNKARMKFLVKEVGVEQFLEWVAEERKIVPHDSYPIVFEEARIKNTDLFHSQTDTQSDAYQKWLKTNVVAQKQDGLVSVGIAVKTGDFSSKTARKLADIIEAFSGDDTRLSVSQSILLRHVRKENLPALYENLQQLDMTRIGFHKVNDIVACPGTDTCNLGISSSMGLANKLQEIIEDEYENVITDHKLDIKISGCMNACGQHTLANIGFQGMTMKVNGLIAPATQLLLGGGVLGNGEGRFADKVLKTPSKKTPDVLRWILNDFEENQNNETFNAYYDRKTTDYFYQNLKHFSDTTDLQSDDFVDWGAKEKYEKAIGIGECAGVTIDLVQTLLFEAEESLELALESKTAMQWSDSIYYAYSAQIKAAKALLTTVKAKTNSHHSIKVAFDEHFKEYGENEGTTFEESVGKMNQEAPTESFTNTYLEQAHQLINWIKNKRNEQ
jgi:sulfite reductase (ferredoxin)